MKLKTGDLVKVITGNFRNLVDNISRVDPKEQRVYLNKATRKQYDKSPANKKNRELKEVPVPIHISNVKLWEEKARVIKVKKEK